MRLKDRVALVTGAASGLGPAVPERFPGIRSFALGHLGDGDIHDNPIQAEDKPAEAWHGRLPEVSRIVHAIVSALGGSITAERGVGRLRIAELQHGKSPVELEMMARLKRCFDPLNLMPLWQVLGGDLLDNLPDTP